MKKLMMRRLSPLWGALALALVQNLPLVTQNIPTAMAHEVPKAQCVGSGDSSTYTVVCGYNCIKYGFTAKCADWPGGSCSQYIHAINCGPPAPPNWILLYVHDECNQIQDVRQLAKKQGLNDDSLAGLQSHYCHSSRSTPWRGR